MVSRTKTNASQRPRPGARRAKTSPNLRTEFSTHDSETDRKHALIAADVAYERVYGRGAGRRDAISDLGGRGPKKVANVQHGPRLERRQSVRFAGPNAEPTRTRSITRREVPEYRTSQEMRRHSLQSEPRNKNSSNLSNEDTFLTALPEEFGENDKASAPSSYRKLRKAKSMFSPGKTPSAVFLSGIPKAGRHFQRHSQQSSDGVSEPISVSDPRLRSSLPFLRGVTDRTSTTYNHQYATQDAAIQLARDTYLQQLEQQRLKEQPSFLNLSKHRTKAFRRTVRSSSTNSYGTAIGSSVPSEEHTKVNVFGFDARSLSQNLKTKIKRVLRRSKNDENKIPVQQLNASHAHYGHSRSNTRDMCEQHCPTFPEPNAELLRRVGSQESVEQSIPYFDDNDLCPGSIRSVHSSDDNENKIRSRVSSWTNSSANNTFIMPQTIERKRLSVIKEDGGPHQPSSSARFYGLQRDGYVNFRQPVSQTDLQRVETERVFSALQREIEDNKRRAELDDIESGTGTYNDKQRPHHSVTAPRRSSSLRRRPVPTPDNVGQSPGMRSSKNLGASEMLHCMENGSDHHERQQSNEDLREGLTPQEIAEMNESKMPLAKRPLREVKSAFFPPSMRIERSSTSPFRRAMQAADGDEDASSGEIEDADQVRTPDPFNSTNAQLRHGSTAGSESIYSRSLGGNIAGAIGSDISLARSQSSDEAGTAIITTKGPAKYDSPRYSSANSSGDWKNFMASQVASLERHEPPNDDIYNALPVKVSGHKRESAQIDEDDVKIGGMQAASKSFHQPLGVILGDANAQSPLHLSSARSIAFNSSPNWGANMQVENTPKRPSYPYAYKISNAGNENVSPSSMPGQFSGLGEKTPQNSSVPSKAQKWLSTSPSVRSSPERAERLRRLKNSSTTSLRKPLSPNQDQADYNETSKEHGQERQDLGLDDSDVSHRTARSQVVSDRQVVNSFIQDRNSYLNFSGESGADPAFI